MLDKCVIEDGTAKCVCLEGKKGTDCDQNSCEGHSCGFNGIYFHYRTLQRNINW